MGSKDLRILEKKSQDQMKTNVNRKYESGIGMQNVQSNVFFLKSSFLWTVSKNLVFTYDYLLKTPMW